MQVKDLREQLERIPGEIYVYNAEGMGINSVAHIFRGNLIGVEQFCELITQFEQHTPQFEDIKIERYTGCKDRVELIEAFLALKAELEVIKNPPPVPVVMVADDIFLK